MVGRVFICHSSADAEYANDLCARLEANGVTCWIAPRDPLPGIPYGEQLVKAIEAAHVVLLLFSASAGESRAVLSEVELASNRGKIILPVRIEDIPPPPGLEFYVRPIHWFDATHAPLDQLLPHLVRQVRSLFDGDPAIVAAPTLHKARHRNNNLPQQLTSLVGRAGVVAEITSLLGARRLVTVAGTGGAGKTRCALQTGAEMLADFGDGVWLIELAALADPVLVTTAIAQVLGIREARGQDLLRTVIGHLEQRRMLLVLDNCEHLVDEARRVAAEILRGTTSVRVLATSREQLGIAGEYVLRLAPLSVGDAVELFVERARASDNRFELSDENAPFVTEICRRLDGIPLALELAAARVKLLSPKQLTEKLNERFRLLTGGDKSALPHHQALRATIDWSFGLLDESARAIFRRLALFAAGWTLEGAAAICSPDEDEWTAMEVLSSLADKSLVSIEARGDAQRYDMLVSIREYAKERLTQAGELESTAARHARFYADFVQALAPLAEELEDAQWRRRLASELDNVRAAIDWTIFQRRDPKTGLRLLAEMEWPERVVTPNEALKWYEAALETAEAGDSDLVRARLFRHRVMLEWLAGRPIADREKTALAAVDAARRCGDPNEIARALGSLGTTYVSAGRFDEAERTFVRAQAEPERLSRITLNSVLRMSAVGSLQSGDVETARNRFLEVVRSERPGSEAYASALLNLGELEYAAGDVEAARTGAQRAKETYAAMNSIYTVLVLTNLAAYALAAGDLDEARTNLREALALQPRSGRGWLAYIIEAHALLAALCADCERAALLAGFSDALYRARGDVRQRTEHIGYTRLVELLGHTYTENELASLSDAGARLTEKEALAFCAAIHT